MRGTRALLATAAALAAMAAAAQSPPPQPAAVASGIRSGAACRPAYPAEALKAKVQGDTQLRLSIDTGGRIASAEVIKSAGLTPEHKLLDQAAADALSKCKYRPGTDYDRKPAGGQVDIQYRWKLE